MEILYKKKVIRDFLSLYSESSWTQLVSHILEYGIILFKKKFNVAALSPEDIYKIVENFKNDEHIYDKKSNVKKIGIKNTSKNKNNHDSYHSTSRKNSISATKNKKFNTIKINTVKQNYSDKNIFSTSKNKKNTIKKRPQTPNRNNNEFKNSLMSKKSSNNHNNSLKRINSNTSFKSSHSKSKSNSKQIKTQSFIKKNNLTTYSKTISNDSFSNYGNEKKDITLHKNKKNEINNLNSKNPSNEIKNLDNKLIHFNNEKNPNLNPKYGTQKVTAQSKIKELIERDKKKHQEEMKLMKENPNNNLLNNTITNNNVNFQKNIINENFNNENLGNKTFGMSLDNNNNFSFTKTKIIDNSQSITESNVKVNQYGDKFSLNDAPIISIEDKLNGLTQKLSKLNSSFNKTREILSGYNNDNILNNNNVMMNNQNNNNSIPYFKNDFLNKTNFNNNNNLIFDRNINTIQQNDINIIQSNILSTNNNDEDYIGEDQIDLSHSPNSNFNIQNFENK